LLFTRDRSVEDEMLKLFIDICYEVNHTHVMFHFNGIDLPPYLYALMNLYLFGFVFTVM